MIDTDQIRSNPAQLKALTSLEPEEFDALLSPFRHRWHQYHKHYTLLGKRRKRPRIKYKKPTKTLPGPSTKLLFVLMWFKTNSIQQQLAAEFGLRQSHVSHWLRALRPILQQAIEDLHCQPAQDMDELIRLFRQRSGPPGSGGAPDTLNMDVTERPIGRNLDDAAQRDDYSGKHHGHHLKNTVLCDEYQFVHFAGQTWNGSVHDSTMAVEELPSLKALKPYGLWFSKDKGYQGYRPEGAHLIEPFKARRNHPLTELEKEYNAWASSIRSVVEHAIGGIKRLALLSRPIRYWKQDIRHQIFIMGCGLHNLRVRFRSSAYARGAQRVRARLNF
jgi:hypothetical protein